ncbi:MAG TPA: glycerol-3-phosphate dehydrogenase/oxidase [Bacteroidales bacterium]|nr:glycerol-3-phosphate dehydrogenase/oxidase [Bacteroidales bacterium]
MNRQKVIDELRLQAGKTWDIIVTGGGATGLGIALDAVTRGYSTLLLEQSDFAKGTSSKSTKLVHGGVRYLAQGDIFLVIEALKERGILLKNAPGITKDQEFIIPLYSIADTIIYTTGLKLYDLLARKLSLGRSVFISRNEVLLRLPNLEKNGLKGGVIYHDGQFDDSRLAIILAKKCSDRGGFLLNYCRVNGFIKSGGIIAGVEARDEISGEQFSFQARLVVNATGVFTDTITELDDPAMSPSIRPSQGVHIVLDRSFLGSTSALMIPKTPDGRVLFIIPWYDKVVAGTTDTPVDTVTNEPVPLKEEIDFILETAGKYLVRKPERSDILSTFAGLRPLAIQHKETGKTKEISRRHKISFSHSGLLSITGGKWTTYRRMAEETIDAAIKKKILEKRKCLTSDLRLTDNYATHDDRLKIYNEGAAEIRQIINNDPGSGQLIDNRLPYCRAEIRWICRNEMPVTLEDVLARRTRSLLLDARASLDIAPEVVSIMSVELGFDENWKNNQLAAYREYVKKYL